jgi:hypothetical protein
MCVRGVGVRVQLYRNVLHLPAKQQYRIWIVLKSGPLLKGRVFIYAEDLSLRIALHRTIKSIFGDCAIVFSSSTKNGTQKSPKSTATGKKSKGFTDEERVAIRERRRACSIERLGGRV